MDDLISRQATIEHLKKRLIETALNNIGVKALCDSIFADTADNRIEPWVNEVPSAQPERKTGQWIPQDYNQRHGNISTTVYYYPKCSVCGCYGDYTDAFCKSCGADMRGEQDE